MTPPNEVKMVQGGVERTFAEGLAPRSVAPLRTRVPESSSTNADDWLEMVAADPAFYLSGPGPGQTRTMEPVVERAEAASGRHRRRAKGGCCRVAGRWVS